MTTVQLSAPPAQAQSRAPSLPARVGDVLAFEWIKLRSLRSNFITLSAAAIVTIGVSVIVGHALSATHQPLPAGFPGLNGTFLAYAEYAVIPVSVLAGLQFTSEYGTGLIRSSFTAVPRRFAVLAGKAAVVGAAALVTGEVLAIACFSIVQAMASAGHRGLSLGQPGVTGAVLAGGFVLCACALTAVGMGAIIRSTPGAIIATLVAIYLLGSVCLVLPSPWKDDIGRFTMAFAAFQVTAQHPQAGLLSPWASMLVLVAWPAAALLAAGLTLSRRDVG